MNIVDFLSKLRREGKLDLIESSEEIKKSYLEKSESNLFSAKLLLKNNLLEESVSLIYYSMYNVLLALLFKSGIKSENHVASMVLLNQVFEKDNLKIRKVKKERINAQYYVDFQTTKEQVKDLISIAEEFNSELLDFISKLSNEEINLYRNKFIKLLNLKK